MNQYEELDKLLYVHENEREYSFSTVYEQLLRDTVLHECMGAIEKYSGEVYLHSVNVARIALMVSERFHGINRDILLKGALLHDYGKIFIPSEILNKPGRLDMEERRIMEMHPVLGYEYLKRTTSLSEDILKPVLEHHERMDGKGYAKRKTGNQISFNARIVAIADVYDAMVSDRVYRKGLQPEFVKNHIKEGQGKHFDVEVTMVFLNMISKYGRNVSVN